MFTYTHYTIYNKWSFDIKTVRCDWAVLLNMHPNTNICYSTCFARIQYSMASEWVMFPLSSN